METEAEPATKAQAKGKRSQNCTIAAPEADAGKPMRKAARVSKARKAPAPANEEIGTITISHQSNGEPQWRACTNVSI